MDYNETEPIMTLIFQNRLHICGCVTLSLISYNLHLGLVFSHARNAWFISFKFDFSGNPTRMGVDFCHIGICFNFLGCIFCNIRVR